MKSLFVEWWTRFILNLSECVFSCMYTWMHFEESGWLSIPFPCKFLSLSLSLALLPFLSESQVPFTHTLACKQISRLSRIYWNNLSKYDKFGYEICRRACELSLSNFLSLSLSLCRPHPLPLFTPVVVPSANPGLSHLFPTCFKWYLLEIGSIATWLFRLFLLYVSVPHPVPHTLFAESSSPQSAPGVLVLTPQ